MTPAALLRALWCVGAWSAAVSARAGDAFCSVRCVCCDEKPWKHVTCAASAGGTVEE